MILPPELAFLDDVFIDPSVHYKHAEWLKCDFDEDVWPYDFDYSRGPKVLDWNTTLDDSSILTGHNNRNLLNTLKYWLVISTKLPVGESIAANALKTQSVKFRYTIRLIDYLIQNATSYELSRYGIAALSKDDFKFILDKAASNNSHSNALFDWDERVCSFALELVNNTDASKIDRILEATPSIAAIDPEYLGDYNLPIPVSLIPRARAALLLHGYITRVRSSKPIRDVYNLSRSGYTVDSRALSAILYNKTLYTKYENKPLIKLFVFSVGEENFTTEFHPIPVASTESNRATPTAYNAYCTSIYRMGELHSIGLPAPHIDDLVSIADYEPHLSSYGRFRTLPSDIVFTSVRNAIEFHIKYGKALLNSYIYLAAHAVQNGITLPAINRRDFLSLIENKLVQAGVDKLGLSAIDLNLSVNDLRKGDKTTYFKNLRNNKGLIELVCVYYGCAQVLIGALIARRQGEMAELVAGDCLDATKSWLLFDNRKSTVSLYGIRNKEARPIEPIAVEMINNITKFQESLLQLGVINGMTYLFNCPLINGSLGFSDAKSRHTQYNLTLNFFCDYFETNTDKDGRRYYIRQHQLRRFFALVFFHSSSFGGLETLQWMLGHTDISHVWHYITEATDGSILRGAKAQFIAESLHRCDTVDHKDLSELIKSKYGTDTFSVISSEELEDYILDLMEEGVVEIEPEFYEDENGEKMHVITKITHGVTNV
ncbi:MAG: hypothetical protein LC539_16965 [Candidatus Thiodiazotropha sp.]|nr:hypothetical protein [Candidatus Thiodiazotropha sp.]